MAQLSKRLDMTEGDIPQLIISFSLPLLLGTLFQQLYNMVDAWVVGNFVSNEAFSAVGTLGPITNLFIGMSLGLGNGTSVVIAQNSGAKRKDIVSKTVHTAIVATFILSILLTLLGIVMIPSFLSWMSVPEDVYQYSYTYLYIYFLGIGGLIFYNIGSAILRGIGDSKRPFYFLATSAIINILGDLILVLYFGMGVEGVALATVVAQAISAILVLISLFSSEGSERLILKELHLDLRILKQILVIGIPSAIQRMIIAFSNIFVQGYVNHFGSATMGGWSAYNKVDAFIFMPMQSLAMAMTTFVGQNIGVNNEDRAKIGVKVGRLLALLSTIVVCIPVVIFAPQIVAFFNQNGDVIRYGSLFLRCNTPLYILCCSNQILAGALRGAGNSKMPMIIMIFCFVVFRQFYLFVVTNYIANTQLLVALSYPAGWLLCSLILTSYYHFYGFGKNHLG